MENRHIFNVCVLIITVLSVIIAFYALQQKTAAPNPKPAGPAVIYLYVQEEDRHDYDRRRALPMPDIGRSGISAGMSADEK